MRNIESINNIIHYQYPYQEIMYNIFPLLNTYLKDKNNQDIHIFDILQLDSWCLTRKEEYFICIWNCILGRIEFLLFDYAINDFIWFDSFVSKSFVIISNGDSINGKKIPKIIENKIQTMIDFSNEYYSESD